MTFSTLDGDVFHETIAMIMYLHNLDQRPGMCQIQLQYILEEKTQSIYFYCEFNNKLL